MLTASTPVIGPVEVQLFVLAEGTDPAAAEALYDAVLASEDITVIKSDVADARQQQQENAVSGVSWGGPFSDVVEDVCIDDRVVTFHRCDSRHGRHVSGTCDVASPPRRLAP